MGTSDMTRIVQKFGGTSVADMARIKAVAATVKRELDDGNEVAVVLSAMAGVTDQLVGYVAEAGGAEQRVAQRVQRDVAVGVRHHSAAVLNRDAADGDPVAGPEGVHVEAVSYAHHSSSRRRSTASASARSSGPVTLRLAARPATSAGR